MEDEQKQREPETNTPTAPEGRTQLPQPPKTYGMYVPSISTRLSGKAPVSLAATPDTGKSFIMQPPPPPPPPRVRQGWDMELPLIPATLIPGAYNRFAHAAAMNVVDDPGMICNPLMVFGEPGSGKTHFIHYIAYTLSSGFGLSAILVTDGRRLARGIEQALADGTMDRLEAFLAGIKVLIIDDLHRLEVSAANKRYIAKFLDSFIENNKQVILASGFPPDYIAGLEDAAGFQFTQGWIVDLKKPTPQQYKAILDQRIRELGLAIPEAELTALFFSGNTPSLTEAIKTLESMKNTDMR